VTLICGTLEEHLLTASPIISYFIKILIGLTFLVLAYTGCLRKEAVKWISVTL